MSNAPWLDLAKSYVGEKEVIGKGDNPKIVRWFKYTTLPEKYWRDSTYWCSVFMCAMVERSGYKSSRSAMARSWLKVGTRCKPQPGAIPVWPRGKPPSGHVSVVEDVDFEAGTVTTIDGNVSDRVKRVTRDIEDALDFRWPNKRIMPNPEAVREVVAETKKVTKVAVKSKSVWMQLSAAFWIVFGYLTDGLDWLFGGVMSMVNMVPSVGNEIETQIITSQKFAGWLGISWGRISLFLVIGLMLLVAGRHIRDKLNGRAA